MHFTIIFTFTFVCILKELFEIICIRKHLGVHAIQNDDASFDASYKSSEEISSFPIDIERVSGFDQILEPILSKKVRKITFPEKAEANYLEVLTDYMSAVLTLADDLHIFVFHCANLILLL